MAVSDLLSHAWESRPTTFSGYALAAFVPVSLPASLVALKTRAGAYNTYEQFALYCAGWMIYNLYFHPLRAYPGPFWARACRLWYINAVVRGTLPFSVYHAHQKYGGIVRVAPDELAYGDAEAWKEIYGIRAQ